MQTVFLLILTIGACASVRERKSLMMWRSKPMAVSSPFASALAQLVGTAGGIYLSLELLFSFLKLPEDLWSNTTFVVEPLALISLTLAIVQPYIIKFFYWIRK
ncbi:MAG: hypothetical protein WA131_11825 [Desulfitobacteriaceae bacterium]